MHVQQSVSAGLSRDLADQCQRLIKPLVEGRPWIVAVGSVAHALPTVKWLEELGATRTHVLGESLGPLIDAPSVRTSYSVICRQGASNQLDAFRRYRVALRDLPATARRELDEFDPQREARAFVAVQHFVPDVGGRPSFAPRRRHWEELEDKTIVDSLWDAAGIPRAPSLVVRTQPGALRDASRQLDRGQGTVWAGDSREGYNSGGHYIRWIKTHSDRADAFAFYEERCDSVRVMPFLPGVPCSIHGLVFRDYVAVFRPVRMLIMETAQGFKYVGSSTLWSPSFELRRQMRNAARRVGSHIREAFAYRGAFTIDGVLNGDNFLPVELNPRPGAAFARLKGAVSTLPLALIEACVRRNDDFDFQPRALETLVVRSADAHPSASGWSMTETQWRSPCRHYLCVSSDGSLRSADDARWHVRIDVGPSQLGGQIHITIDCGTLPHGISMTALVASGFEYTKRQAPGLAS